MKLKSLWLRTLNSPTIMTWASLLAKGGNSLLILPLIVVNFTTEEINLWFVFMIMTNLRDLLDFGFSTNISRSYSYALGGVVDLDDITNENNNQANHKLISQILGVSKRIYFIIFIIAVLSLLSFGTMMVYGPLSSTGNNYYWIDWAIIVMGSSIALYGNVYTSLLVGLNQVALVKKWDTIFGMISFFISLAILLIKPNLTFVIINIHLWFLFTIIRNAYLANFELRDLGVEGNSEFDEKIWANLKSKSRRSFVAALSGFGLMQFMSIFIANVCVPSLAASYLFANKLMEQIKHLARAPFYSKLPYFALLESKKEKELQIQKVRFSMRFAYSIILLGTLFIGLFSDYILHMLDSNVQFVAISVWIAISAAALVERFSAMSLQYYTLMTNHVIVHKFSLATALVIIASCVFFYYGLDLGIISFPLSVLFGYLSYYTWAIAVRVYNTLKVSFLEFESKGIIPFIFAFGMVMLILFFFDLQ